MKYLKDYMIEKGNYYPLNKKMVEKLGLDEALFLTNLIEAQPLVSKPKEYFFQTVNTVLDNTGFKRKKQESIVDSLIAKGLIRKKVEGIGKASRRYFLLQDYKIANLLDIEATNSYIKQSILDAGHYWIIPKIIIKRTDATSALFLSALMDAEIIFEVLPQEELIQTISTMKLITGLSRYRQGKAVDELTKLNLINENTKRLNGTNKRVFNLNYDAILKA